MWLNPSPMATLVTSPSGARAVSRLNTPANRRSATKRIGDTPRRASNAFCRIDQFRWTRGEGLVREFKVPEAKFHTTAFCSRCGSKVPRISAERGIVVVPAGSLDTDPGIRPMAHIFVADKAPWFDIADTLPQFPAMPPAPG